MRRSLAAAAAALALTLTACDGQEPDDPAPSSQESETTTPADATTSATPASRLTAEVTGTSVCLDDVPDGDVLAFTGPALRVEGGPVTITGISSVSSEPLLLRQPKTLAMRYPLDDVDQPPFVTADTARGIGQPSGYVRGSRGPLVGTTFDAEDAEGFVPFLEATVDWPNLGSSRAETDAWVQDPEIAIEYTDDTGQAQTLTVATRVTLYSADQRC